jgi:uncharacterized protein (DUF169 family)
MPHDGLLSSRFGLPKPAARLAVQERIAMEIAQELGKAIGGRWLGVSCYAVPVKCKEEYLCPKVDRFCEALNIALAARVLFFPRQLTCLGARYAFGCGNDAKEIMARRIAETKGYTPHYAAELIERTPHFQEEIQAVGINMSDRPNLFIAQLQPMQAMRLIGIYEKRLEKLFRIEISGVISACGNVAVKAFLTQDMAISFGCEDSRKFGGVSRDKLYAGIPFAQAKILMSQPQTLDTGHAPRSHAVQFQTPE